MIYAAITNNLGETRFIHVVDCHIHGGKYELSPTIRAEVLALKKDYFTVLGGDNIDFACAEEVDLVLCEKDYDLLNKIHEENIDDGNHEKKRLRYKLIKKKTAAGTWVLFIHYDLESNEKRWTNYRSEKPKGVSWWKKMFWMRIVASFDGRAPKPEALKQIAKLAKQCGCTAVAGGHYHPPKPLKFLVDGIDIRVSPQGINELWIK